MSQHDKSHDSGHLLAEADVSPKLSILIWIYLFVFAAVLFLAMGALTIYFRYEMEKERLVKIDEVEPAEKIVLRNYEQAVFVGNQKVVEGKRQISINEAMNVVVNKYSQR